MNRRDALKALGVLGVIPAGTHGGEKSDTKQRWCAECEQPKPDSEFDHFGEAWATVCRKCREKRQQIADQRGLLYEVFKNDQGFRWAYISSYKDWYTWEKEARLVMREYRPDRSEPGWFERLLKAGVTERVAIYLREPLMPEYELLRAFAELQLRPTESMRQMPIGPDCCFGASYETTRIIPTETGGFEGFQS